MNASHIVVVGTGDYASFTSLDRQNLGGGTYRHLDRLGARHVAIPAGHPLDVCEFVHGMTLRSYRFDTYRTVVKEDARPTVDRVTVVTQEVAASEEKAARLKCVADGVFLTRDLVSEPANTLYPAEFARRATALGDLGVSVTVLGETEMAELGMGLSSVSARAASKRASWSS